LGGGEGRGVEGNLVGSGDTLFQKKMAYWVCETAFSALWRHLEKRVKVINTFNIAKY
jgi:hypothetical protein